MNTSQEPKPASERAESDTRGRAPYEPPCILSREPLEALAAVCVSAPPLEGKGLGQGCNFISS